MANVFSGWTAKFLSDGVALIPPEGRELGALRVREWVRPLRSVRQIVDRAMADLESRGTRLKLVHAERLTTHEGEYAAVTSIRGLARSDEHAFERSLGIVFGDDSYHQIDGLVNDPAQFNQFRRLVNELTHVQTLGLGTRRRRFAYKPPTGWQGLGRGRITEWYPRDYPNYYAFFTVLPVRRVEANFPQFVEKLVLENTLLDFKREGVSSPQPIRSQSGLEGHVVHMSGEQGGKRRIVDLVAFEDRQYIYLLRHEASHDVYPESTLAFREMCESCEPIPHGANTAAATLAYWAE